LKLAFFDDFALGVVKGKSIFDVSFVAGDIPHGGPCENCKDRDQRGVGRCTFVSMTGSDRADQAAARIVTVRAYASWHDRGTTMVGLK